MFGQIVVGDGGEVATTDDKADKTEATPGFMGITALIASVARIAILWVVRTTKVIDRCEARKWPNGLSVTMVVVAFGAMVWTSMVVNA